MSTEREETLTRAWLDDEPATSPRLDLPADAPRGSEQRLRAGRLVRVDAGWLLEDWSLS